MRLFPVIVYKYLNCIRYYCWIECSHGNKHHALFFFLLLLFIVKVYWKREREKEREGGKFNIPKNLFLKWNFWCWINLFRTLLLHPIYLRPKLCEQLTSLLMYNTYVISKVFVKSFWYDKNWVSLHVYAVLQQLNLMKLHTYFVHIKIHVIYHSFNQYQDIKELYRSILLPYMTTTFKTYDD